VGKLTNKLQEAVKKLSYSTTVDQLKRKGIQKVNVVGLDRIVALIEAAVHRTLKARMAGLETAEMCGEIAGQTRDEFLRLLHSNESLEKAHQEMHGEKSALEEQVALLRTELQTVQGKLASRESQLAREAKVQAAEEDQHLHEEIHGLLAQRGMDDERTRGLVQEVFGLVRGHLEVERTRVTEARRKEYQTEVELLNRRLAKLNGALAATEDQLQRVMKAKTLHPGLPSVYKKVQGLDSHDSLFAKKTELMESIFEANLRLRREIA
jgi:hypothetical protein